MIVYISNYPISLIDGHGFSQDDLRLYNTIILLMLYTSYMLNFKQTIIIYHVMIVSLNLICIVALFDN